jgi:hypothetical protein
MRASMYACMYVCKQMRIGEVEHIHASMYVCMYVFMHADVYR